MFSISFKYSSVFQMDEQLKSLKNALVKELNGRTLDAFAQDAKIKGVMPLFIILFTL